jgi:hypothetical protein
VPPSETDLTTPTPLAECVKEKIAAMARRIATAIPFIMPDYDFERSILASSDLNMTEIMCRAALLVSALESMRRNSIKF